MRFNKQKLIAKINTIVVIYNKGFLIVGFNTSSVSLSISHNQILSIIS